MSEVECIASSGPRVKEIVKHYLRKVEGRVKTFIEAITEDPDQCRARKDLVWQMIWSENAKMFDHIEELFSGGDHGLIE